MKGVVDGGGGDRLWKSIDVKNLLCKRAKRKIHPNEKILKIKMIEMNDTDKDNETNRNERVKKKQNQQHLETNKSCYCLIFFTRLIFRTIFFFALHFFFLLLHRFKLFASFPSAIKKKGEERTSIEIHLAWHKWKWWQTMILRTLYQVADEWREANGKNA